METLIKLILIFTAMNFLISGIYIFYKISTGKSEKENYSIPPMTEEAEKIPKRKPIVNDEYRAVQLEKERIAMRDRE